MKILKAGALYYAIFVSFFIALISGFMILQQWYQRYYILYVNQGERLERNLHSACLIAIQNPGTFTTSGETKIDLFQDSTDLVTIGKKWWGGYQVLDIKASWRIVEKSKKFMVGTEILAKDVVTLYLADDGKYLSIAGKTGIKGNCYIPKLGIRKAYIEGAGYNGNKLIDGTIKESGETLPDPNSEFIKQNLFSEQLKISSTDSLIDWETLTRERSIEISFYNKTLRINSKNWLTLENIDLKGNIKIFSASGITIKNSASLQDIIIYAPKIVFNDDFKGALQCFVSDTLQIGSDCIFKFPTVLALTKTNIEKPFLEIGKGSLILGDIIAIGNADKENVSLECILQDDSVIHGTVYCNGRVNMKGSIRGQLFCKGFILKTYSSIYENHLMNAKLDGTSLSQYYAGSMHLSGEKLQKTIKCLD